MSKYSKIYFIGIGGIGMSAIARYYKFKGYPVAGYDRTPSDLTRALESEGIEVHYKDDIDYVPKDVASTLVVYTPAIPDDMGELSYVREQGYTVIKRSRMLGELAEGQVLLAVAGTHGKTTTSTLVAHILTQGAEGCSAFLGGISKNYGTNLLVSHSPTMVAEADEFDRSFLQLHPAVAAITAMDEGIGRVLEALEKTGLAENTAVFFSGDNGMNLGQHGIWGKGNGTWPMNMYDTSVRVPFIAWGAGIRRGARVENLYSHVDVLPTLCDALGAPLPGVLPGESFLEELTKGRAPGDRQICILDEYGPVRMIRTRTHKYIHEGIRGSHQLYDLTSDPGEEHNLFGHPAYAAVQEQLRQRLEEAFARFTRAPFDGAKTSPDGSGQNAPITYTGEDVFEHTTRLFRGPRDPGRQTAANAGSRAIRTETSKQSHEPNGSV